MTTPKNIIQQTNGRLYDFVQQYGGTSWNLAIYSVASEANEALDIWQGLYEELVRLNDHKVFASFLQRTGGIPPESLETFRTLFPLLLDIYIRMGSDKNKSGGYHILGRPIDTTISSITPLSITKNTDLQPSVARKMIFFYSHDPKKAAINSGNADYRYLSNWTWTPFVLNGIRYHSVEQYMMWGKAILFDDQVKASEILATGADDSKEPSTAKVAKIMGTIKKKGREVSNYNENVWATQRYNIVLKAIIAKFTQNDNAKRVLLETGDARLFEASSNDKVWGIGVNAATAASMLVSTNKGTDLPKWSGSNLLGIALEEARTTIRDSQ